MATKKRGFTQEHKKHYAVGTTIELKRIMLITNGKKRFVWGANGKYYSKTEKR